MTWFRLDDQGAFHRKVVNAGNEAYGAWCRAGQWCSAQLTDGRISRAVAVTIGPWRLWLKLLEVGLCDDIGNGELQIHDFLDWNPSREEVLAERARKAGNMAAHRKRIGAPAAKSVTAPVTGNTNDNLSDTNRGPDPDPDPRSDPPISPPTGDVRVVLEYWAQTLYPIKQPKFDDKRKRRVKARLAEGFTADQLKLAIDGAKRDDFLMGKLDKSRNGGYRDVSVVLRDAAQVERLMALAPRQAPPPASEPRLRIAEPEPSVDLAEVLKRAAAAAQAGKRSA